jgi:hypothetical protein
VQYLFGSEFPGQFFEFWSRKMEWWQLLVAWGVGVLSAPFTLPLLFWYVLMFPVLYWDIDIYEEDHPSIRFWQMLTGVIPLIAVLHFFTPFDAAWLITGGFWMTVLKLWQVILGYFGFGIIYAMLIRWPFYLIERNNRLVRPAIAELGQNPPEEKVRQVFARYNLDGYGSRVELITRWIYTWFWDLPAWLLTDFLKNVGEVIRHMIGGRFRDIYRALEPKEFKALRAKDKTTNQGTGVSS